MKILSGLSLKEIEELCITNGLDVKRSYFRQEEIFKSLMPFNTQNEIIKKQVRRNILTNGIKSTYPFITSRIVDETIANIIIVSPEHGSTQQSNEIILNRLKDYGAKIYRTDLDGEVSIEVNKKGKIRIEKFIE